MPGLQASKILVPFDYSKRCISAVRRALQITPENGEVTVMYVMTDFYPVHPAELYPEFSYEGQRKRAEDRMKELLSEADVNLSQLRLEFAIGDPGTEVAEFAKEQKTDLVVVPSHGRRGFKRMVLGSVAERIARLAPCPVLIVKEDEDFA